MMELDREGMECLATSIVKQAVYDWRNAHKRVRTKPDNEIAQGIITDCETFFLSSWFTALTDLDGKKFLAKLKEELRLEEAKERKAKKKAQEEAEALAGRISRLEKEVARRDKLLETLGVELPKEDDR